MIFISENVVNTTGSNACIIYDLSNGCFFISFRQEQMSCCFQNLFTQIEHSF